MSRFRITVEPYKTSILKHDRWKWWVSEYDPEDNGWHRSFLYDSLSLMKGTAKTRDEAMAMAKTILDVHVGRLTEVRRKEQAREYRCFELRELDLRETSC